MAGKALEPEQIINRLSEATSLINATSRGGAVALFPAPPHFFAGPIWVVSV